MFKKILIFSISVFLFSSLANSQNKKFSKPHDVDPDVNISQQIKIPQAYNRDASSSVFTNTSISNDPAPQNEPSVKISWKDPNRVVAAWRDFRLGMDPTAVRRVGYSFSTDGGITWSVSALLDSTLLPGGLFRNSDPVVGIDIYGNFYIGVIALNNFNGNGTLAIYKSTDEGETFPVAVIMAQSGSEDKEYITTDFTQGSPYKNTLYMSWTRFSGNSGIKLTKSNDGALTWSAPVDVSDPSTGGQGSDPAIGKDGEVYVIWWGGGEIVFDKSVDGGNTFGTDVIVTTGPDANNLPNNAITLPSMVTDTRPQAGPDGIIYVTFCDARNADPDVFVTSSIDRGRTWSTPLRVNNDAVGNGKLQYWPWIALNEQGNVSIIFMDTRNTPDNVTIEAWLARSSDGGLTFTNELLSTQQSPTNIPGSNVRFGDYIGVDYRGDRVVTVWPDERAGGFNIDIFTADVNEPIGISNNSNGLPKTFALQQNYPNPFNPSTTIWFSLPKAAGVTLSIYNTLGQVIETPINESLGAGNFSVRWDGTKYSSGIYFYKLSATDGFSETKKMLMIK